MFRIIENPASRRSLAQLARFVSKVKKNAFLSDDFLDSV